MHIHKDYYLVNDLYIYKFSFGHENVVLKGF